MAENISTRDSKINSLNVPDPVKEYLNEFNTALQEGAGDNLQSVIIYGGIARGQYRPMRSDINILILLKKATKEELDKISSVLHAGKLRYAVTPMIMTAEEVKRACDVFPVKFLHMKNYNIVIYGDEIFEELTINPQHIRLRLEQELRNISIRLRNRYINIHSDDKTSAKMISQLTVSFAVMLRTLMELCEKTLPTEHTSSANLAAAAEAFDLDKEALLAAVGLRKNEKPSIAIKEIFGRLMKSVDKAVDIVDKLEVKQ